MRLEPSAAGGAAGGAAVFQFHKGAIRTTYQNRLLQEQFNFNSIKVRLEHYTIRNAKSITEISIP